MSTTEAIDPVLGINYELVREAARQLDRAKDLISPFDMNVTNAYYAGRAVEALDLAADAVFNAINDLACFFDSKEAQRCVSNWHREIEPIHDTARAAAQDDPRGERDR